MNVTLTIPIRDGAAYVDKLVAQIEALEGAEFRVVVCTGDNADDTWAKLLKWFGTKVDNIKLIKYDTCQPHYKSVVDKARFAHLSNVFNRMFWDVDFEWSDYVCFIPGDVIFEPDLITRLTRHQKDIIAPFYWTSGNGQRFYDIWGFRHAGQSFPPYPRAWYRDSFGNGPVEMDTVGGVICSKAEVLAAGVRYTPEEVDHGFCKTAHERGFTVWADPTTHVWHR